MSIYVVQDFWDIVESVQAPHWVLSMQKVLKNKQLAQEIFDYKRSHFSVAENVGIFQWYSLDHNFGILRQMCSLWDSETEHVTSLITGFSVTDEDWNKHDITVWEWKYKSALFLYWLSEWADEFTMDDKLRQYVWDYFWHKICDDAINNTFTQHTTGRYLLNWWGSRVTITRPWDPKKWADSLSDYPPWQEHAHRFPNGSFGYIAQSVILARWTDNNVYCARPFALLKPEQQIRYNAYQVSHGEVPIIPDTMDIQEIIMDDSWQ